MGIPFVVVGTSPTTGCHDLTKMQAPSEAEAQCAELARGGKVRPVVLSQCNYTYNINLATTRCMLRAQRTWIHSHFMHPSSCVISPFPRQGRRLSARSTWTRPSRG